MHKISYANTESSWDEALPLGNGHYGVMAFNEDNSLIYVMNHYDVYYRCLGQYSKKFEHESMTEKPVDTSMYELIQKRALEAHENTKDPAHYNYNFVTNPEFKDIYGWDRNGITMPPTGEMRFNFSDEVKEADFSESCLEIEKAQHFYTADTKAGKLSMSAMVFRNADIILTEIKQTSKNMINSLEIMVPDRRNLEVQKECGTYDSQTVYIRGSFYPFEEETEKKTPFKYILAVRLIGVDKAVITTLENKIVFDLGENVRDFHVLTSVVTEAETSDLLEAVIKKIDQAEENLNDLKDEHREYWEKFWSKSSISIPDKMLEKLWYIGLYVLECCSGNGARLYEQACGLNGLWDIRQPSQWGSSWYWDVNIEQSFWPVYTSNHLETGEAFYRGLLSNIEAAKKRAREFYGFRGIAPDYPFDFYICIWPWCAQFLWWHYKYSGDMDFLKEKAYPIFRDLLYFFEDYLKYDVEKEEYYIFPDISPEQGPMTRNSTITLTCLKYLLKVSIEANRLLQECSEDREKWENILAKLPFYALGESQEFGKTIKDSEWASPTQFQAHSSPLMPIYPIGDISKRSTEEIRTIGKNTLKYASNMQCLGTHNFGWEACTAARMGMGDEAVGFLYEKGIAFLMRSNGLFAEETERWLQNCLTASAPVYNPPLIEAGSAVAAAINEMLLHSFDSIIEVFPALPQGKGDSSKKDMRFDKIGELSKGYKSKWEDLSFKNLLAEGAFEVSASCRCGRTFRISIKSLSGNIVRLVNPFGTEQFTVRSQNENIEFLLTDGIVTFPTQNGKVYEIEKTEAETETNDSCIDTKPEVYVSPTNRRVFLGKDENTNFLRELDSITFDYYQGDIRTSKVSVYRFDFSLPREELLKNYASVLPRQYHACGKQGLDFRRVTKDLRFTPFTGFGWEQIEGLKYEDRTLPDEFRRDFISGDKENKFLMELPKGQYQVFIASGDYADPTFIEVEINGQQGWKPKSIIKACRFEAVTLPFVQWSDGIAEIRISSKEGYRWKVNMMIINRIL